MEDDCKICFVIGRNGLDGMILGLEECWIEWKRIARYTEDDLVHEGMTQ